MTVINTVTGNKAVIALHVMTDLVDPNFGVFSSLASSQQKEERGTSGQRDDTEQTRRDRDCSDKGH
jgi:hypothetical protein